MWPVLLAAYVVDICADAVAGAEGFPRNQFVLADHGFGAAEIDRYVAIFHALDGTVDDLTYTVFELVVLALTLGVFHALNNHLFRGLRGDATEIDRRQFVADEIANRIVSFREFLRHLLGGHLLDRVERRFAAFIRRGFRVIRDHFGQAIERNRAGFLVDIGLDVVLNAIFLAAGDFDRVCHCIEHGVAVDVLLARNRFRDLQHFGRTVNCLWNCHV